MNVRVCGPNLSSASQQKGDMHVHAADCNDLNYYGPGRKHGGDVHGTRETLIKDASIRSIVEHCYFDQIAESGDDWENYVSSFWFAPCCQPHIPYETPNTMVYECWLQDDRTSFEKITDPDAVIDYVRRKLQDGLPLHKAIHIVGHSTDEYQS